MKIQKGDYVHTPRFLNVKVQEVFSSAEDLKRAGYTEPTHFNDKDFEVLGKSLGENRMEFAAGRKRPNVIFAVISARRYAPEDTTKLSFDGLFWDEESARQYILKDMADTIKSEGIDEDETDIDDEFFTIDAPDCHHQWKIEPASLPNEF